MSELSDRIDAATGQYNRNHAEALKRLSELAQLKKWEQALPSCSLTGKTPDGEPVTIGLPPQKVAEALGPLLAEGALTVIGRLQNVHASEFKPPQLAKVG